jgi:uncharacterized repeat protein (TIGR01451 family)
MRRFASIPAVVRLSFGCFAAGLCVLLVFFGTGSAGARARTTLTVCPGVSGDYIHIQDAVNAASAGDTILVCDGLYVEQVVIDKTLTLEAEAQAAEIKAPPLLVPGPGLSPDDPRDYSIVTVNGADVTIRGFTIAGPGGPLISTPPTGENIGEGVNVIRGGAVTLTNNHITDIRDEPLSGGQYGFAAANGGTLTDGTTPVAGGNVTATGNTIDNYQKGGFYVSGPWVADIENNTVDAGQPREVPAPNGIQVSHGASGIVKGNVVLNNNNASTSQGTGILIYLSSAVTVTGNTVEHNQYGIFGWSAAPLTVAHNTVTDSLFGIDLFETSGAVISDNTSIDAIKGGLLNESPGTGNTWLDNSATGALSPDTDCTDQTTGAGTAGTGNTWTGNVAPTASPVGICTLRPITTIDLDPVAPDGPNGDYSGPVHVTVSADPAGGPAVTETRCVLDPPTPPTTFSDLPSTPCPYLGNGAQVHGAGHHTIYAMSINAGGLTDNAMRSTSFTITESPAPEPPPEGPNLKITKTASTDTVHPGGQVSYELVVQNLGPGEGSLVTVEDPTPAGLVFHSAVPSQGHCALGPPLRCELGKLVAGGEALIQVTATVAAHASGSIVNHATVWDDRLDPNLTNNTASATVHVTPGAQAMSDLVVTKHVDRHTAAVGQRLHYTITVTNKGPDTALQVKLTDTPALPIRVVSTHVSASQGSCQTGPPLTCSLGRLRPGARAAVNITAVTRVAGVQINTVGAISENRDPHPKTNVASARTLIHPERKPAPPPPRVTG